MVVRVWDGNGPVNLQVFLDGDCQHWATSRVQGHGPGEWTHPEPQMARIDTAGRHSATAHLAGFFTYDHLPPHLQAVSRPCAEFAHAMIAALPDGPELTVGLRKLLEAKDAFVRAALPGKDDG
jgi:hypothetical protein